MVGATYLYRGVVATLAWRKTNEFQVCLGRRQGVGGAKQPETVSNPSCHPVPIGHQSSMAQRAALAQFGWWLGKGALRRRKCKK